MVPRYVISALIPADWITGRPYPHPLPPRLQPWHVHLHHGGHVLVVALVVAYSPYADPGEFMVPVPVRQALAVTAGRRRYTTGGALLVDLPYDPCTGVITDPDTEEP